MKKLFYYLLFGICIFPISQAQIGEKKYWQEVGKSLPIPYDNPKRQNFGNAVSVNGNYAVIGAQGYEGDKGCVYILHYTGSIWEKVAKLMPSDQAPTKYFGSSVHITDNLIVVGANGDNTNGTLAGAVYVFEKPATGWTDATETAKLTEYTINGYDNFGGSVSTDGDIIVVGAQGYLGYKGGVFVFEKPTTGWVDAIQATAKLSTISLAAYDYLGISVSISGNTIVAGASGADVSGTNEGAIYVYEMPTGGWGNAYETAKLTVSDGADNDELGRSVCIDNNHVVGGAYRYYGVGGIGGAAYVFKKPTSGWADRTEIAKLTASDVSGGGQLGIAVSISGDIVAAGARAHKTGTIYAGATYVFQKPQSGWADGNQNAILTNSNPEAAENLGQAVSVNGDIIFAGAPQSNVLATHSGSAYIYQKPGTGWADKTETQEILPDPFLSNTSDLYGISVAMLDSTIAVVGARGYKESIGCAYILEYDGSNWNTLTMLTALDGTLEDYFGHAVAITNDYIAIGAYKKDAVSINSGAVYIFEKGATGWADATQKAILTNSNTVGHANLGFSLAAEGDVLVAGAYNDFAGKVLVYEKPTTGWTDATETAILTSSDGEDADLLGYVVDIVGNVIIAGARNDDDNGENAGAGYVFEKTGSSWSTMTQTAKLLASNGTASSRLGDAVSISGDVIAMGAPGFSSSKGAVYLYEKPAEGWVDATQSVQFTVAGGNNNDYYGNSVSIEDNCLIVGASGYYYGGTRGGAVYFYEKNTDNWDVIPVRYKTHSSDPAAYDDFGIQLALSGNYVIISATGNDDNGASTGSVYLMKKTLRIVVLSQPDSQENICEGNEVRFTYEVANADSFYWYGSDDNLNFVYLQDEAPYNGVRTNSLNFTAHDSLEHKTFILMMDNAAYSWEGIEDIDRLQFSLDNLAPVISNSPSDLEVQADANNEAILSDYTADVVAVDNCSDITITQLPLAGTTISGDNNEVTLYISDARDNNTSLQFNVAVKENPIIDPDPDPNTDPDGLDTRNQQEFKLYPNPTQGIVYIEAGNTVVESVQIMDISGRIISTQENPESSIQFDLSAYPGNIFILKIKTEKEVLNTIVIKE